MKKAEIVVVGAGLAGLIATRQFTRIGKEVLVVEANTEVGGRVQSDWFHGFRLDRGFQVFLTAYPNASRELNCQALHLRAFEPGAKIHRQGRFAELSNPLKKPSRTMATAFSSVATWKDKILMAKLQWILGSRSTQEILLSAETSAFTRLRQYGFSEGCIDGFFRPFFGGVFFDRELLTSSRMFEFTFKMFAEGAATLPRDGIQSIPKQIASHIAQSHFQLGTTVARIEPHCVTLDNGQQIECEAIVLATNETAAAKLLGKSDPRPGPSTECHYFACDSAPISRPILLLEADANANDAPVNHVAVPSLVQPSYAPPNQHLICLNTTQVANDVNSLEASLEQMRIWFGDQVDRWRHLRTYRIHHALPNQTQSARQLTGQTEIPSVYRCGDYCETASIEGAISSGLKVANDVLASSEQNIQVSS